MTNLKPNEIHAHVKNRKLMRWGNNNPIKLSEMTDTHLKSVYQLIKDSYKEDAKINGYSKQEWLNKIKTEVEFRNKQIGILADNTTGRLRMVLKKLII